MVGLRAFGAIVSHYWLSLGGINDLHIVEDARTAERIAQSRFFNQVHFTTQDCSQLFPHQGHIEQAVTYFWIAGLMRAANPIFW